MIKLMLYILLHHVNISFSFRGASNLETRLPMFPNLSSTSYVQILAGCVWTNYLGFLCSFVMHKLRIIKAPFHGAFLRILWGLVFGIWDPEVYQDNSVLFILRLVVNAYNCLFCTFLGKESQTLLSIPKKKKRHQNRH